MSGELTDQAEFDWIKTQLQIAYMDGQYSRTFKTISDSSRARLRQSGYVVTPLKQGYSVSW